MSHSDQSSHNRLHIASDRDIDETLLSKSMQGYERDPTKGPFDVYVVLEVTRTQVERQESVALVSPDGREICVKLFSDLKDRDRIGFVGHGKRGKGDLYVSVRIADDDGERVG
ncbi:MAG: hypothetical protein QGF00_20560 [Planctomycetota bacterium]|jgi:hypothetical protein|nr:hypothetical protein [Planctomycetota bacterium]MDP7252014.1 hypothetical protein [Planctomycetota bacterium]